MLGIYIWALLIIFITIATAGWEVILFPIIGFALWALLSIILDSLREKWREKRSPRKEQIDREKAIDEWERIWHRKHPTRK
jgi:membrane protein implicated in regulation of membrane protease activity